MGALEYFRSALKSLHTNYLEAVKDLSPEHLDFRPLGKGNSIAFTLWHTVRTEDNVINFGWRQKPTIWMAEGWDRKFGLDPKSQGTGMTAEEAGSIRISDLSEFRRYMEKVYRSTEEFLDGAPEKEWDEVKELRFLGKRNLYQLVGGIVLQHGSGHLGEIWYLKGLQGLKGSPI